MTIAWLLGRYPALTETFIAREIEALRARGFEVQIWALNAGEGARQVPRLPRALALRAGLNDVVRGNWKERPHFWRAKGLNWVRACREEMRGVDLIHAGWANYISWIAQGAAQELGVPWSFSGHAGDLWVESGDLTAKMQKARVAFSCTCAGAEKLRAIASDSPQLARVVYAPHGLAPNEFSFFDWAPAADGIQRIISIGRLVPQKGFDVLIDAVAHLRQQNHRVQAQIFGEGLQRSALEAQITQLNLTDVVRLEGALQPSQVAHVMGQALREGAVFALPCRIITASGDRDGLPNVLLEAAASGLPLIATDAVSVGDFVDDTTGSLCRPNDALALAQSLRAAWDNPEQTRHRCVTARSRVEAGHDIERTSDVLAHAFLAARGQ